MKMIDYDIQDKIKVMIDSQHIKHILEFDILNASKNLDKKNL